MKVIIKKLVVHNHPSKPINVNIKNIGGDDIEDKVKKVLKSAITNCEPITDHHQENSK